MSKLDEILNTVGVYSDFLYGGIGVELPKKQMSFDFERAVDYYYDKPVEFAEDLLNFRADKKQSEILESVRDFKRTAVRSGQGVGKTATVSCLIIWYLCTRYNSKIIATAPNITQLYTVLWAEIAKWMQDSIFSQYLTHTKTRMYMNGYEKTWFAFPKTATTAEGIAGQHADNLLVIADEASGIKDDILETLLGTITGDKNKLLFISNPTRTSGVYYDSFFKNASSFNNVHIDAEHSMYVDRENIEMLAKSYGKGSNVYRVRVKGEFPTQEDDTFVSLELASKAAYLEKESIECDDVSIIKIGVDVARFGDDSTVICTNVNNDLKHDSLIMKNGQDLMSTVGDIVRLSGQLHIKYKNAIIYAIVDDIGVGGGVIDRLNEIIRDDEIKGAGEYLKVVRCNVSESVDNYIYDDMTTMVWGVVRELMMDGELSIPDDNNLIGQLTTRKYSLTSRGKMKLEGKRDMKKRGLKSPDIADAVAMSCMPLIISKKERPKSTRR